MKAKYLTIVPAASLIVFLFAALPATQEQAQAADNNTIAQTDPMQFASGAKTWAETCSRCHNMRDPRSLRDDQWRAAIAHMRVRAGLTAKEAENVLVFLQQSN